MDIKMIKNCLLVFLTAGQFPPSPTAQKKIKNEHIIGMVTWLNIPIHPVACSPYRWEEEALSFTSDVIAVTRQQLISGPSIVWEHIEEIKAVILLLPTSEYIPLPWELQRKEKYIYSGIHLLGFLSALSSVEPQSGDEC